MPEDPSPPPGKSGDSVFEAAYRAYLQCLKAFWAELDVSTVDLKELSHHPGIIFPCPPCPSPATQGQHPGPGFQAQPPAPAPGMWPCQPPPGFTPPSTYGTYGTYGTSGGCWGTAGPPGPRPG
jgi:hypothetical protein